jgi:uncharacterized protein (TIGR03437 family)
LLEIITTPSTASGPATITITGGTGGFANATGTFNATAAGTGTGTIQNGTGQFTITGSGTLTIGTTGPVAPAITAVVNNYSYIPPGFPNSGVAPGSIMLVEGTGMADPSAQAVLESSAAPNGIPKMLNGASFSVTVNGTTVTPGIYYAIASHAALVLPAGTPTGNASITVTYNGVPSAPFQFVVVPSAMGFGTYNGQVIATGATDYSLYSYIKSAKPGDTLVLWGSGLGAIAADSGTVYTQTPHAYGGTVQIYIGGIQAQVLYAGDSGFPGLNQIDVTVPSMVEPGCNVSLIAVSGTGSSLVSSNSTFISVDPFGGACSDPAFGATGGKTISLIGQANVSTGFLSLAHDVGLSGTNDTAESVFQKLTSIY